MRNNKNKYARLAPTTILTAWIVFAMSPLVHATEYSLPEVVVTVKPMMSNSPMIGRDVSKLDMTAWNSHNAAEALVQTPGVNVQYGGSSGDARAWIRGFRHRDVLILFDGIPIASAFEGTIDLNEITLSNVAEVKVLTGAPSVIYGANGMGGVIDFIPSDGLRDQALTGRLEVGKNSTWRADADFGGNAGAVNYYVSGSYDTSDGFELSDDYVPQLNEDGGLRTNSDHLRKNVFGYASAESSALGKTSVFVNFSDAERGFNLEAGEDDPDFERLAESKRQTVGLSNQFESIPLSAKLFYNSYDSQLNIYTDATYSEIDEIEITEDYSIGGMLYSSLQLNDKNLLVLSAAYRTDKFEGVGAFDDFDKAPSIPLPWRLRTSSISEIECRSLSAVSTAGSISPRRIGISANSIRRSSSAIDWPTPGSCTLPRHNARGSRSFASCIAGSGATRSWMCRRRRTTSSDFATLSPRG